ncbi:MAG: hypothetical protein KDD49_04600 [Bacteroidetes bacterium]|nr:hypothetical protein [Bacteroidota bacterium]MCB9043758.1 hypothetical protein [Chitinophagales bacterium]
MWCKPLNISGNFKILVLGILICWLTIYLQIFPVSLIVIIATTYKLLQRKPNPIKYIILLLSLFFIVPAANVGMGLRDYIQGTAHLKLIGYPAPEFANIDYKYRVNNKSLGCIPSGFEYLNSSMYNQTVKYLITNFGYQKNSYTGVYPTRVEAISLINSDKSTIGKVAVEDVEKINILVDEISCTLELNKQHGLIRKTITDSPINKTPRLCIKDGCLICQLNEHWIYLIEVNNSGVIAQYRI